MAQLTEARERLAELLGVEPSGVRAVEITEGRRAYLAAVGGDGVACLVGGELATSRADVEQVATAGLLWEFVEETVDPERLDYLLGAAARALAALADHRRVSDAVGALVDAVHELRAWRIDPLRARASLPDVDRGAALQERAWNAYGVFVRASEPLVARQDALDPGLVSALRVLEEAAARAGVIERLTDAIGQAIRACGDAAPELADRHVTPLR